MRRLVRCLPLILGDAAHLAADIRHRGVGTDRDLHRHRELFPLQRHRRGVRRWILELVFERFFHLDRARLHRYAQGVFGLVVGVAAPGSGHFGKNHRPRVRGRDHVEAVRPFRERLTFDRDRVAYINGCVFIRARAPDFAEAAPDFATVHEWAVISDFDVGQSNALLGDSELTDVGQVEISPDGGPERKNCKQNSDAFHNPFV